MIISLLIKNASIAESRLTKKHNSVYFHRVRESVTAGIMMPYKIHTEFNLADILTESLNAVVNELSCRK